MKKSLLLLGAFILLGLAASETIDDFEGGYFKILDKKPALYNLEVGVDQYDDGAIPMAYADLNSDS